MESRQGANWRRAWSSKIAGDAYLDTSSLVKLHVEERDSPGIRELAGSADILATSVLAYPEMRATLARRRRERLITLEELKMAVGQLDASWPRLLAIPFTEGVMRAAGRLAEAHGLRGGDAVHLASFEDLLTRSEDEDVRFSCADARLLRAARSLG